MAEINPDVGIEFSEKERAALQAAHDVLVPARDFMTGLRELLQPVNQPSLELMPYGLEDDLATAVDRLDRLITLNYSVGSRARRSA